MSQVDPAYLELRQTPLHIVTGAERERFCREIAKWLDHPEPWIRSDAAERLASAILWDSEASPAEAVERLSWLLDTMEAAHRRHVDILPAFIRHLRYQLPSDAQLPHVLAWLDRLERDPPAGLDPFRPAGVSLLLSPQTLHWPEQAAVWIGLLDHPSDWLRGCAALMLGERADDQDGDPSRAALMTLIGEKEIQRPGIAGPFWSVFHVTGDWQTLDWPMDPKLWMLDLLELRQGPAPALDDMPGNDIAFFLHELCCESPELVDRMLDGGFAALAVETATEIAAPVAGMEQPLVRLAHHADPEIAAWASRHLHRHYGHAGV